MMPQQMGTWIVRHSDLRPCCQAFIRAHPLEVGRNEGLTIGGSGVTKPAHLHTIETLGFDIGAAGQRPFCYNALHSHRTAPVVRVLKGALGHRRWRSAR